MSLSHAISAARSGLQVSSLRADIAATNVSNANTPGYVRRSVLLGETLAGGATTGVGVEGITRSANAYLTSQRMEMGSDLAQASVLASAWQSLSSLLGDSTQGSGLFKLFSEFETALSTAVASPESSIAQTGVIDAANAVVSELNGLSDYVYSQRADADREIAAGVATVNDALQKIEALNTKLSSIDRTTSQAAALMDERQLLVDTISEFIPVQTIDRQNGKLEVLTKEGVYLLAGTARTLEFTPSAVFRPEDTYADGDLSGITVDGLDLTPGQASYSSISSGLLGALFTLRDTDLPHFQNQLDTVAQDLITRLSDDTIDPTKTPGEAGLFVDTDPAAGAGVAGRIALNALVDPAQSGELFRLRDGLGAAAAGPAGNSSILSAIFDALTSTKSLNANGFSGAFSATELVANFSSLTGQARISSEAVRSSTAAQHSIMTDAEQSQTGVDIDDQMQQLLMIEQAYAANARVIEIASQMIQRLMEL